MEKIKMINEKGEIESVEINSLRYNELFHFAENLSLYGNNELFEAKIEILKLTKENIILNKALELACKELMPYRDNMCGGLYTTEELTKKIDYFIEQAKREK